MPRQFICPECGTEVVTFRKIGESMPCKHCSKEIEVPANSTEIEGGVKPERPKTATRRKFPCPECGNNVITYYNTGEKVSCSNCNAQVAVPEKVTEPTTPVSNNFRSSATQAIRVFAWLDLIGSIIIGLFLFATGSRWFGLALIPALAVIAQGVFVCSLFVVLAEAAEDLKAMRAIMEKGQH